MWEKCCLSEQKNLVVQISIKVHKSKGHTNHFLGKTSWVITTNPISPHDFVGTRRGAALCCFSKRASFQSRKLESIFFRGGWSRMIFIFCSFVISQLSCSAAMPCCCCCCCYFSTTLWGMENLHTKNFHKDKKDVLESHTCHRSP